MPIVMECVDCDGRGCEECNDTGEIKIEKCPLLLIDHETQTFIQTARMYLDHGLPPVAGGSLDQTIAFIDGCNFVNAEIQSWKRELGILDG